MKCSRPIYLCPNFGKGARIAVVLAGLLREEILLVSCAHGTVGLRVDIQITEVRAL